jgi:hypothetical protein
MLIFSISSILDVEWIFLPDDMKAYVVGQGGNTRKKIQLASGCIIQYINDWASFGGYPKDRKRGIE